MSTTVEAETIAEKDRQYRIRRQGSSHRYPVTAPTDILENAGIEHKQKVGFAVNIDDDGRVNLRYSGDRTSEMTLSAARYESTGELRVPSAIGAILELGDEELSWTVEQSGDVRVVNGETTRVLDEINMGPASPLSVEPLDHITQDIDTEEHGSWSQEQFRLYMNTDMLSPLGWVANQRIELSVRHNGGTPLFVFGPTKDETDYVTQRASETGRNQVDATVNFPNAVVRGFGVLDTDFMWSNLDGKLVSAPQTNWETTL